MIESGRQRTVKLAVKPERWQTLKACYERLRMWLNPNFGTGAAPAAGGTGNLPVPAGYQPAEWRRGLR